MFFGKYPQNSEARPERIEWNVLRQDSNALLLISKYALITSYYCDLKKTNEDLSFLEWQHSLARERCFQFYESAFSAEEKEIMVSRETRYGESHCEDYVFLLTEEEVKEYLPDLLVRKAIPTDYSLKKGARLGWTEDTREYTSWWIMPEIVDVSPGRIFSPQGKEYKKGNEIFPKAVFQNGDVQYHSRNVYHGDFTIRPCILIDSEKFFAMKEKAEYPKAYM